MLKCGLASAAYVECEPRTTYKYTVGEGTHTFLVQATDSAGNVSVASYQWSVDLTPPTISLKSKPSEFAASKQAIFSFSFDADDVKEVRCARDDPKALSWCDKDGERQYFSLAEGLHTFYVEAEDKLGNVSQLLAYSWTVDTKDPHIEIKDRPREFDNSAVTRFSFSSDDVSDVKVVLCAVTSGSIPSDADFRICSGSMGDEFSVAEGKHTFFVRAKDAAGNASDVDKYTWTADRTSPETRFEPDGTPKDLEKSKSATFVFFSDALDWAGFECSLNDEVFSSCLPGIKVSANEGVNKFRVRAVDTAGNKELSKTHEWTVDTIPPLVNISEPKPEAINTRLPYVVGTTDNLSEVRVLVDGVPQEIVQADRFGRWLVILKKELGETEHTITAEATDPAGNPSAQSTSVTFTVDVTAPVTKFERFPDKVHRSRTAEFMFSSEAGVEFQCKLDVAEFAPCKAERVIEGLSNGIHTFSVKARDKAGNVEPSPVSYTWTVYVDAPLYPDIVEPVDGAEVNTGTPIVSGTAVPNGSVIVFIDGVPSEPTPVDPSGNWTFRPTVRLAEGRHSLSGKSVDVNDQESDTRSPEVYFRVALAKESGVLTGGAAGCSASGSDLGGWSVGLWSLLSVLGMSFRRRS